MITKLEKLRCKVKEAYPQSRLKFDEFEDGFVVRTLHNTVPLMYKDWFQYNFIIDEIEFLPSSRTSAEELEFAVEIIKWYLELEEY